MSYEIIDGANVIEHLWNNPNYKKNDFLVKLPSGGMKMKKDKVSFRAAKWRHPGGKLRDVGPEALSDTELLAILISSGIPGKPAEKIAEEIIEKFGSFKGMANQLLKKFLQIKGLAIDKIIAS